MLNAVRAMKKREGFTLIEILVVIGIIAVLATIVIIAINPARQFKQARNTQRISNVNALLNAIGQNIADNKGVFTCAAGTLPSTATDMRKASGGYDIRPCLVATYMPELTYDPTNGSNTCVDVTPGDCATSGSYDTGYSVKLESSGRITVSAPGAELSETIAVTR